MHDFRSRPCRRDVLLASLQSAIAGPLFAMMWSERAAAQKAAKIDAKYQDHPNGAQHCELCAFYQPPIACRVVRGEVSPNGWCSFFAVKSA